MRRQKGFTLIELLIVVAIIGIIAAIAIPNLLSAINRGRQKRTMADMRTIGTAVESYAVDYNFYPKITAGTILAQHLSSYLSPTYIKILPSNDGWNYALNWVGDAQGTAYTIYSKGRANNGAIAATSGSTTTFDAAIVFTNGTFYEWPEGVQTN